MDSKDLQLNQRLYIALRRIREQLKETNDCDMLPEERRILYYVEKALAKRKDALRKARQKQLDQILASGI